MILESRIRETCYCNSLLVILANLAPEKGSPVDTLNLRLAYFAKHWVGTLLTGLSIQRHFNSLWVPFGHNEWLSRQ